MFCHVANLLATLLSHYLYGQHLRRDYATTSCTELGFAEEYDPGIM